MPLFRYKCDACSFKKEHFVYLLDENKMACPACGSAQYVKQMNRVKMKVEYADADEHMEKSIQPYINEAYEKMGREAINQDTKTAENLFGSDKVEKTFVKEDD